MEFIKQTKHRRKSSKKRRPSLTENRRVAAMDSRYHPKPSKEDVLEWSRSFEKLLNNKIGLKIFHGFLKTEYAEENLLFWLSVERLKKERDPIAFKNMAQTIYNDYVSTESPKEVSIDHKTRQSIDVEMTNPSESIFDSAQKHVYYVMFQDCYPRFLMSNTYKALIMDE